MMYVYLMLCPYCQVVKGIESSIDLNSLESGDFNTVYCCCTETPKSMMMLRERPPCSLKYACYVLEDD